MELIKQIVKVGNSAGVILPKEWLNGKARIELISKPLDIKKEVFDILSIYLKSTLGIYIVGSYARNEETEKSDVDVLVITEDVNKRIKKGKYDILLISKEEMEKGLERNILPLLPMIKEAETLINKNLISEYKKTKITDKNIRFHIETTKSALELSKKMVEINRKEGKNVSDNIIYSLILRLREAYIVDCLIRETKQSNKELIKIIEKINGDKEAYNSYLRIKKEEKEKSIISPEKAKNIILFIENKIKSQERT
jgi:predicted nucleotidyltransferase